MVIGNTMFPRKDIHKCTWISPDQKTRNQIDHVLIDVRHVSSLTCIRTMRRANMDSDHHLQLAKTILRARISNIRDTTGEMKETKYRSSKR